jgi:hypothetical protein
VSEGVGSEFKLQCHKKEKKKKNYTKIPSHPSQVGHHQENKQQMLVRIQEKRQSHTLLVGMQTGTTTISMEFFQKLKIDLPRDFTVPLLRIYPKDCKSIYKRDTCTPVYCSSLHNS